MYKNNYPLYEMDSEENHFNRDDSNLYEEDRTRWIVEVAKNQLNKLDTFNISRNKSIKRNNEDNIQRLVNLDCSVYLKYSEYFIYL